MQTTTRRIASIRTSARSSLAIAVLAAFTASAALAAEDEDLAALTRPQSAVSVGVGALSGTQRDRALFGQYNGLRLHDTNLLLDLDYIRRNDETGMWTIFRGRNLGLDIPEMSVTFQKQGDWRLNADFNQIVRRDPRTINTGVTGIGTTTPAVNLIAPGAGADVNLSMKRTALGFSGEKWLTSNLQFEASFKNEDKNGSRLWGRGFTCTSAAAPLPANNTLVGCAAAPNSQYALLMLPEPVNSTIKQFEAKLNFASGKMTLTGGYYGSFYTNSNGNLTPSVPGTLYDPIGVATALATPAGIGMTQFNGLRGILQLPMALPPDNQAHQLYASGTYAFTQSTRATFKYAYTHATQDKDFASMGFSNAPRSNLGGRMDTNLLQAGITSRPMPKLSLLANFKYEDRSDKTPDALYNLEGVNRFANTQSNLKRLVGKAEGSYQLPQGYRATLGFDYETSDRGQFGLPDSVGGVTALRQKTWEGGTRVELRRAMSETISGAISYSHSRRDGSIWLRPNTLPATGVTPAADESIINRTSLFPAIFTDRKRDKLKAMADWSPLEKLSLQFVLEDASDKYSSPGTKGLRDAGARLYSVDAAWSVTDLWKVTGFVSRGDQTMHIDHSTGYMMDLRNVNTTLGLGVTGKPTSKIDVGANFSYINDRNVYGQQMDQAASAANIAFLASGGGLPDVTFRQTKLNFFGAYALQKNASVRLDLIHQIAKLNEWTWTNPANGVPFMFSDGTTIGMNPSQRVTFLGASYIYRMQ